MKFTLFFAFVLAVPAAIASVIPKATLATRATISPNGVYTITNVKATNLVVDLSAGDNKSIIGYPYHGGENQKWVFAYTQNAWTIKSAGADLYIAPSASSSTNGTALQAVSTPFIWDIWKDGANPSAYRLFVPNTSFNWDLTAYGNSTPGNLVQTWQKYATGWTWQTWTIAST